jgi:hypothetical protein
MASARKQIVAMGGGSFSAEPEGSHLDAYVLALSGQLRRREGPAAGVYRVGADGETITETALPVRLLP